MDAHAEHEKQSAATNSALAAVALTLFKIIVDQQTNEVYAFLFPHKENQGNDLSVVQVTVADVEKASGIVFPLPPGTNKAAKPALWPVDFKAVADNKKAVCKG